MLPCPGMFLLTEADKRRQAKRRSKNRARMESLDQMKLETDEMVMISAATLPCFARSST